MKEKQEHKEETWAEKTARWEKQARAAKRFAVNSGLDPKKIARERRMTELMKNPDYWYDD